MFAYRTCATPLRYMIMFWYNDNNKLFLA